LKFLYREPYDLEPLHDAKIAERFKSTALLHFEIYTIADKYMMERLEEAAIENLRLSLEKSPTSLEAVIDAYYANYMRADCGIGRTLALASEDLRFYDLFF
jgi:hypothetical protein